MLRMLFERVLATDEATAWTLLADPVAMNSWSTAVIESVAVGDGDHVGGVGALRRVRLPRGGALLEVIERETAPTRLEYRVIAGAPVKSHRGIVELARVAGGTQLRWTVEIEPVVGALAPIMRRLLRGELERSLDRLVAIAPRAQAGTLPPRRVLDADADLAALRRTGRAVAAGQGDLADELAQRDDPRSWFARIYHHVTTAILADIARFDHPAWVYRLLPVFDGYFTAAIAAAPGAVEPHWRRAFDHLARVQARGEPRFVVAMHAVYAGMRAHIEDDLPRTLARVWLEHYGPRTGSDARAAACDPARFRADYLRMRDVFQRAADALMAELPRREWTARARVIDALTPNALRAGLIDRHFYPITRERAHAFERATLIARLPR